MGLLRRSFCLFVCAGVYGLLLSQTCQQNKNNDPAIVFSKEVNVNSEPNSNSNAVFTIHEGTKVNILDELDDWKRIRIADGQTGWLQAENVKKIKDF